MRAALHSHGVARMIVATAGPNPTDGIEIGVEIGRTSNLLLKTFPELHLYAVDPWTPFPEGHQVYGFVKWMQRRQRLHKTLGHIQRTQSDWDNIRDRAMRMFATYEGRYTILRMTSEQAVHQLSGRQYDFVFIDGDHTQTKADINRFWPLVRPGGLLAGHDYNSKMSLRRFWDVNGVVDEWAERYELLREKSHVWGFQKPK